MDFIVKCIFNIAKIDIDEVFKDLKTGKMPKGLHKKICEIIGKEVDVYFHEGETSLSPNEEYDFTYDGDSYKCFGSNLTIINLKADVRSASKSKLKDS